ncbi:carboxypeptidase-like regulatory domain-containing protein [Chryseobacterium sp.]|uniref:carboxypeptidase-like regulatory domain-containing protein n=1 Tax=Chryseobacterium sp. TaxID=1871047 RepID=UPI00289810C4|nr:carboxypeptidase-like regulatory domain-containing protein [Chryseobacterium sp.]
MKKLSYLILLTLLGVIFSCHNENITEETPEINQLVPVQFNMGSAVNRDFYGTVLDTSGNPVSGANIKVGTSSTQTDSKGNFIIKNASVKQNFAFIQVEKAGFIQASKTIVPTSGINRVNLMMIPATTTSVVATGATSTVSLNNGTKVKFDGSFKDLSGNVYSGNVNVSLYHLLPSNKYLTEIMPGSFLANSSNGNAQVLETYGMIHVELTGNSGQKLQIANGHTAEITMAIDPSQTSTSPAIIPLWSFDETAGVWVEEGKATKTGNFYVGNVSHFSWWNCDANFDQCILNIDVTNSSNQPLSNVRIELIRQNQSIGTIAYTNPSGTASGVVPANEVLTMKIYNACNNVISSNNIGPFAINSTNTLPTVVIPASATNTITVTGVLKDCNGNNITNGAAYLTYPQTTNYFNSVSTLVNNGSFSLTMLSCSSASQFVFYGSDFSNLQSSGNITVTNTPAVNLGNVPVCTAMNEYITQQKNNEPPRTLTSPISATYNVITANSPAPNSLKINAYDPAQLDSFVINAPNITGPGVYTNFSWASGSSAGTSTGNLILTITNLGAVGQYIDFTLTGTYFGGTLNATGHVLRDQ